MFVQQPRRDAVQRRRTARRSRACSRTSGRCASASASAPTGPTRWEEVHASPIIGPTGAPTHVVEVWRDITERRAAEARMSESHRLASLGMLASGFSHELNTPLATDADVRRGHPAGGGGRRTGRRIDRAHIEDNAALAREQVLRCRGITQHFLRLSRGQAAVGRPREPARDRGRRGAPGRAHRARARGEDRRSRRPPTCTCAPTTPNCSTC